MKCVYCGGNAYHQLKNGKWCCEKSPNSCPERKSKNSLSQKGKKINWDISSGQFKSGNTPWNKGKKIELSEYHKSVRKKNSEVFVEESTYPRHRLKERILKDNMIPYSCSCCGIGPEWNGMPMTLVLDHINGINNDNRIENLRFVCSNCDSQLPTYKSRNIKK